MKTTAIVTALAFLVGCTTKPESRRGDWVFLSKGIDGAVELSESASCKKWDFTDAYIKDNCEARRNSFQCKGSSPNEFNFISTYKTEEECTKFLNILKHALKTDPNLIRGCYCIPTGSSEARIFKEIKTKEECVDIAESEANPQILVELSKTGATCYFNKEQTGNFLKAKIVPGFNKTGD